jgi:hypothetical protein
MNACARSINEVNLMAVFLQESITSFAWMRLQKQTFFILVNRKAVELDNSRSNHILEIHNVFSAKTKYESQNYFVYLLSVIWEAGNRIVFSFSDGNFLRLEVGKIDMELRRISHKW